MPNERQSLTFEVNYATVSGPGAGVPVGGYDWACFTAQGNATTGVLTLYGSGLPNGPWKALSVTLTADECSGPKDIRGYAYVTWAVTTAEAAKNGTINVFMTTSGA